MPSTPFIFPNDAHPTWSIMIVLYPYLSGLVAGTYLLSTLPRVFHRDALQPVSRLALTASLCFAAFTTAPLLLHLHRPERAFNIMMTPNATSAMSGFGYIYSVYMIVLLIQVWLVYRPDLARLGRSPNCRRGRLYRLLSLGVKEVSPEAQRIDERAAYALAVLGIPIACVLTGYGGFLFGAMKANPWWSTALMPVIFLVSALVSGTGFVLVVYLLSCRRRGVAVDADCVRELAKTLWIALVCAVVLELLELVHLRYEHKPEWHILAALIETKLAVSYGIVQLLIGSLVPLLLLPVTFWSRLHTGVLASISALCSVLVLVQVFAMRWNVVVGGQSFSKSWRGLVEYHVDVLGREGLLAAGAILLLPLLALWAAGRLLPLWTPREA